MLLIFIQKPVVSEGETLRLAAKEKRRQLRRSVDDLKKDLRTLEKKNILHNLGYFGHIEKEFKSEEKTKLVISMNSPSFPLFYPLIIIFQVISS